MLILAFDTATTKATAALVRDAERLSEAAVGPVCLYAAIDEVLAEPQDLDAIAVGTGPGRRLLVVDLDLDLVKETRAAIPVLANRRL